MSFLKHLRIETMSEARVGSGRDEKAWAALARDPEERSLAFSKAGPDEGTRAAPGI
jgi:hypothetical protein